MEKRWTRVPRKPQGMETVLKAALKSEGLDRRLANLDLEMAWADLAASYEIGQTRIEHLRAGVLTVAVEAQPKKYELENFHRDGILKDLNSTLHRDKIRQLKVRVGHFPEPEGT